eukprot:jgi/Ulvmu1/383/UM001_0390.1
MNPADASRHATKTSAVLPHLTQSLLTAAQQLHRAARAGAAAAATESRCDGLQRDNTLLRNAVAYLQQDAADAPAAAAQPNAAAAVAAAEELQRAQRAAAQHKAEARVAEAGACAARADAVAARRAAAAAEAALTEARAAQAQQQRRSERAGAGARRVSTGSQVEEALWLEERDAAVAAAMAAEERRSVGRVADARAEAAAEAAAALATLRGEVERGQAACAVADERVLYLERAVEDGGTELRVMRERLEGLQVDYREQGGQLEFARAQGAEWQRQVAELGAAREDLMHEARSARRREAKLEEAVAAAQRRVDGAEERAVEAEGRAARAQRDVAVVSGEEAAGVRSALEECELREAGLRGLLQEQRAEVALLRAAVEEARQGASEHAARAALLVEELETRTSESRAQTAQLSSAAAAAAVVAAEARQAAARDVAAAQQAAGRLQGALRDEQQRSAALEHDLAALRRVLRETGLLQAAASGDKGACMDGMRALKRELQTLQELRQRLERGVRGAEAADVLRRSGTLCISVDGGAGAAAVDARADAARAREQLQHTLGRLAAVQALARRQALDLAQLRREDPPSALGSSAPATPLDCPIDSDAATAPHCHTDGADADDEHMHAQHAYATTASAGGCLEGVCAAAQAGGAGKASAAGGGWEPTQAREQTQARVVAWRAGEVLVDVDTAAGGSAGSALEGTLGTVAEVRNVKPPPIRGPPPGSGLPAADAPEHAASDSAAPEDVAPGRGASGQPDMRAAAWEVRAAAATARPASDGGKRHLSLEPSDTSRLGSSLAGTSWSACGVAVLHGEPALEPEASSWTIPAAVGLDSNVKAELQAGLGAGLPSEEVVARRKLSAAGALGGSVTLSKWGFIPQVGGGVAVDAGVGKSRRGRWQDSMRLGDGGPGLEVHTGALIKGRRRVSADSAARGRRHSTACRTAPGQPQARLHAHQPYGQLLNGSWGKA